MPQSLNRPLDRRLTKTWLRGGEVNQCSRTASARIPFDGNPDEIDQVLLSDVDSTEKIVKTPCERVPGMESASGREDFGAI